MFYSIGENIKNGIALCYTRIFWKNARLVRIPFYARNRKNIQIMNGFTCGYNCRVNAGLDEIGKIRFGKNFVMGDNCQIEGMGGITFGDDVLMASRVFVSSVSHGTYSGEGQEGPEIQPRNRKHERKSVQIGNNVWIGNNVSILSGVTIGNGCVIGANTVVTRNIPDNVIVAGCPAMIIKYWNGNEWCKYEQNDMK